MARQVFCQRWHSERKHQSGRIDPTCGSLAAQVDRHLVTVVRKPKHRSVDSLKKSRPELENERIELVASVEAAEHESILRQPVIQATWCALGYLYLRIMGKI